MAINRGDLLTQQIADLQETNQRLTTVENYIAGADQQIDLATAAISSTKAFVVGSSLTAAQKSALASVVKPELMNVLDAMIAKITALRDSI